MRLRRTVWNSCLVGLPAAALACQSPSAGGDTGWLRATVIAGEEMHYEGSGSFRDGRGNDVAAEFTVQSKAEDDLDQRLLIARRGKDGRPSRGQYSFGMLMPNDQGALTGWTAFYKRTVDDVAEDYVTLEGRLTVVESSDEIVKGAFHFTAVLYCRYSVIDWVREPGFDSSCENWANLDPEGPRVNVDGAFVAVRRTTSAWGEDRLVPGSVWDLR